MSNDEQPRVQLRSTSTGIEMRYVGLIPLRIQWNDQVMIIFPWIWTALPSPQSEPPQQKGDQP